MDMTFDKPIARRGIGRLLSMVMALSVCTVSLAPPASGLVAGANEPRSETKRYVGSNPDLGLRADTWPFCGSFLTPPTGGERSHPVCATFDVEPSEHWITVEIADASGLDIQAWVMKDRDGQPNDGIDRGESKWICGATKKAMKIKPYPNAPGTPDGPVRVVLHTHSCDRNGPSQETRAATTGTITVTFYKKRPPGRPCGITSLTC